MFSATIARIPRLLTTPKAEWEVVARDKPGARALMLGYAAPLAAIPAIAGFIGKALVGDAVLGATARAPLASALLAAVVGFALSLAAVYAVAWALRALAPRFGGAADMSAALSVAVHAPTAAWLTGVFAAVPAVAVLGVVGGLYSLYLAFVGAPIVMKPTDARAGDFGLMAAGLHAAAFIALAVITSALAPLTP